MTSAKWTTRIVACGVLTVAVCGVVLARGQGLAPDMAGSLSALTAEVRQLRLSVERSAQAQGQIQAMAVYLSAQQSRLLQVSARADALRKDLDVSTREARRFADEIAELEKALTMPLSAQPPGAIPMQAQLEAQLSEARRGLATATAAEADLRSRESEASVALQTELARWTEMINRLEQATRQ